MLPSYMFLQDVMPRKAALRPYAVRMRTVMPLGRPFVSAVAVTAEIFLHFEAPRAA